MGYDRGDSFPFNFEPNGIPFGSKSKGKLSPRSYPIEYERNWKYSFLSACTPFPRILRHVSRHSGPLRHVWHAPSDAVIRRHCNYRRYRNSSRRSRSSFATRRLLCFRFLSRTMFFVYTKRISVCFQINREMINTIWFLFDSSRFRKYLSVYSKVPATGNVSIW